MEFIESPNPCYGELYQYSQLQVAVLLVTFLWQWNSFNAYIQR